METYDITYRRAVAIRAGNVAALLIASMPLWWLLGLDQAAWLAAGFALGASAVAMRGLPMGIAIAAACFLGAVAVSGFLGATGSRWLTFAREILIVGAFFGALAGAASMEMRSRYLTNLVGATAVFIAASSALTLFAVLIQDPLTFRTPIADLVPEVIADTRLGQLSLIVRSLGSLSTFLGTDFFLRPQGFFLFSTSEAVALAAAIPLFLAASSWWPRWSRPLRGVAGLAAVALIATTTRVPIAALAGAGAVVWIARGWTRGHLIVPLNRKTLSIILVVLLGVLGAALALGVSDPILELVAARNIETRASLYEATVERWAERPLLGWGTEVDWIPTDEPRPTSEPSATPTPAPDPMELDALPPLGSHSQYLGVLFKQGIVGLLLFVIVVGYVSAAAVRLFRRNETGDDLLVVGFLATVISAVTESLWLDPATAVLVAILWGTAVGRASHAPRGAADDRGTREAARA